VNNNIGASDGDVSAIIGVLRFGFVRNGGKKSSGDMQRLLVNRERGNVRDRVEVPDDRSVHIHIAVFIDDKDIGLRRSVVLVQSKPDVVLYVGIGNGDQAGAG